MNIKPEKPNSLEGRWDILYRDYPEVYDEWVKIPKVPDDIEIILARFPLEGKIVVDLGSGTGNSTFKLARYASFVIGIEIEPSMLAVAKENASLHGVTNVRFDLGDAEHLPLEDASVDAGVGMTLADRDPRQTASEMERVVRRGGQVLRVDVAPGWYGGDVYRTLSGEPPEIAAPGTRDAVLADLDYDFFDIFMEQEYGTVDRVVRTYGFIHSDRVIEYLRAHHLNKIRWKFRVRFKTVE